MASTLTTPAVDEYPLASPIVVPYETLADPEASIGDLIEKAYGYDGLGLIVISDVPTLPEKRQALLPLAYEYSKLPEEVKEKTVNASSHYSNGWSHGKEKLKKGQFDTYKGSYYNNPQYDVPSTDPEAIASSPEVLSPNVWPEDLPALEPAFKSLGQLIVETGKLLAHHVDAYVSSKSATYVKDQLFNVIDTTRTTKARLLHYFTLQEDGEREIDSWCGWHNDHSALTGLCPAIYIDTETGKQVPNPDPHAGLHAKSRNGKIVRVKMSGTSLAFQIGECSQVFSGGVVRATPHAVRAMSYPESKVNLLIFSLPIAWLVLNH
eukprot:TRINITY_DN2513_c0_g1_i2.p1 TRINITY_DN2513_c0_g1~~TRINITY_DN2513_c0_g1_i2.p1  ORF type:complete len:329 (-),score=36.56 TRINITY_DN2513_c0_g1_i2:203-1165(-)